MDETNTNPTETTPEVVADAAATEPVVDETTDEGAEQAPVAAAESPEVTKWKKEAEGKQRRIDELTWRERERERQDARPPEPVKQAPVAPPTLEDFAFDETKYRQAQAEWTQAEIDRKVAERFEQAKQEQTVKEREQKFRDKEKAFAAKNPDYAEKVYDSGVVPISQAMAEEITQSEIGPELAFYFANNTEFARQLYALPPRELAREIGRLEARLAAPKAAPVVPRVSQAPPPPARISATDSTSTPRPDSPESDNALSDAEWAKLRNKQAAKRAAARS